MNLENGQELFAEDGSVIYSRQGPEKRWQAERHKGELKYIQISCVWQQAGLKNYLKINGDSIPLEKYDVGVLTRRCKVHR